MYITKLFTGLRPSPSWSLSADLRGVQEKCLWLIWTATFVFFSILMHWTSAIAYNFGYPFTCIALVFENNVLIHVECWIEWWATHTMYLPLSLSLSQALWEKKETTKRELYVGLHVIKANVGFYWTLFLKFDWNNEFTLISLYTNLCNKKYKRRCFIDTRSYISMLHRTFSIF